jgi:hypothetical protein
MTLMFRMGQFQHEPILAAGEAMHSGAHDTLVEDFAATAAAQLV